VINPGLDAVLAFYPQSGTNEVPSVVHDKNDGNNLIVKLDHSFSQSELLTGRYAFAQSDQVFPFGSPGGFGAGSRLRILPRPRRLAFRYCRPVFYQTSGYRRSTRFALATAVIEHPSVRSMQITIQLRMA